MPASPHARLGSALVHGLLDYVGIGRAARRHPCQVDVLLDIKGDPLRRATVCDVSAGGCLLTAYDFRRLFLPETITIHTRVLGPLELVVKNRSARGIHCSFSRTQIDRPKDWLQRERDLAAQGIPLQGPERRNPLTALMGSPSQIEEEKKA